MRIRIVRTIAMKTDRMILVHTREVHGAFADGSGWKPVTDILQSHG
jgi:hypothetical protein